MKSRFGRDHPHSASIARQGFTLVELAVSLFIIALLLGSILVPLATQVEQRQISDTQQQQDEIKEALIGFSIANGYLPCPAISATNGQEDRAAGVCVGGKRSGFLPWETLGISRVDSWGRLYRYSVGLNFASSATPFTLSTILDITVRTRDSTGALINLTNANSVPAVIISHGKNGYGGSSNEGTVQPPAGWPAANTDENTNVNGTTIFVSRPPQAQGASGAGGEFDDIVTWVPHYVLINRMVAASKLP